MFLMIGLTNGMCLLTKNHRRNLRTATFLFGGRKGLHVQRDVDVIDLSVVRRR